LIADCDKHNAVDGNTDVDASLLGVNGLPSGGGRSGGADDIDFRPRVGLDGSGGDDAKHYQEKQVAEAIEKARRAGF
jgi:hypothetical protein